MTTTPPPADLMALTDYLRTIPAGDVQKAIIELFERPSLSPQPIEEAPFYWRNCKQDAATGYCNGWNDCVKATEAASPSLSAQAVGDGWLPIESAPKDQRILLCCMKSELKQYVGRMEVDEWWDGYREGFGRFNSTHWPATHWKPLPPAPGTTPTHPADGVKGVAECSPVPPEEERAIDDACGLVKVTLRLPADLHKKAELYAFARQCVLPAAIRELLENALSEQPADGGDRVRELVELLTKYQGEYDTPCPDLTLRHRYRADVFAALAKFQPAGGENDGR